MVGCYLCNFQVLKIPDLKTKYGEIYHVYILKSKIMNHNCIYSPKRIPENVCYFLNDLPTVQFLKVDNLLKRRFYTICPPIQRKRLWNCSRTCSKLGRKPTTLIVGKLSSWFCTLNGSGSSSAFLNSFHMIPSTNSIVSTRTNQVLLDDFVMDFRYELDFGFDSKRMAVLAKFADFNQTYIRFVYYNELTRFYPIIFTPKITAFASFDNARDLSPIWPLLPNLETLSVRSCMLPILFKKMTYFPKLTKIYIMKAKKLNYSMFAKFLRNQDSNLWLTFTSFDFDLNEKLLFKHFMPVEKQMRNQKGLCFTINVNEKFFVLR